MSLLSSLGRALPVRLPSANVAATKLNVINDRWSRISNSRQTDDRQGIPDLSKSLPRSANFSCSENVRKVRITVCSRTTQSLQRSWSCASSTCSNVAPRRRSVSTSTRASLASTTTPDTDAWTPQKRASSATNL